MDTISLAEDTIKNAIKKGCDKAEVFIKTAKRLSVEAKNNSIAALESARDFGIALRVIRGQRLGFSFTTNPNGIKDIINEAVGGTEWTSSDKYIDIPDCGHASDFGEPFGSELASTEVSTESSAELLSRMSRTVEQLSHTEVLVFDEKIKNIKDEDIIKSALLLEKACLDYDKRIKKVRKAEVFLAVAHTTILNSKGVKVSYESSHLTATATAFASDGRDSQTGWDFATSRRLSDINFVSVAESASKKAIDLLGARKISSIKLPVILAPSTSTDFLGVFSASLSADAVQKKRSFLAGKVGKNIISPIVNIVDDGLMPWKIGTKPVDDEGVPTLRKSIVSSGLLTGFIHNSYTAKKDGVNSTGNAVRRSFKSLPDIDITNLYIEPKGNKKWGMKNKKENKLIKSVPKGLLILETMGIHTANPISGDFSIGISGLWIENGEITYPVKEAVMSGNILELFNRIEDVGDDLSFYGNIGSPSLLIGEIDISA